ncbi:MAG: class II aldolase [Gemmatimonadales bacterium]|nr:class II aldolase [Gemmatimonadales bacterium]
MTEEALREAVVAAARKLVAAGLAHGTSGNVSVRVGGGLLITPSGVPYEELAASDIVRLDEAGHPASGSRAPSSEWRMHRDIYASREEAFAVVHTHSLHATALACLREELPAVHYMVAAAGGAPVRCAGYATFGTAELSAQVLQALEGRRACLLANHGLVTIGADLREAFRVAQEIERVAEIYLLARAAGRPNLLTDKEMAQVVKQFGSYGQPETHSPSSAD